MIRLALSPPQMAKNKEDLKEPRENKDNGHQSTGYLLLFVQSPSYF